MYPKNELLMHMDCTCRSEGQLLTDEVIGYVWLTLIFCRRYCSNKSLRASGSPKLQMGEVYSCVTESNLGTS